MNQNFPNPVTESTTFKYHVSANAKINLSIYDLNGKYIDNVVNQNQSPDEYQVTWRPNQLPTGFYLAAIRANGRLVQTIKINVVK